MQFLVKPAASCTGLPDYPAFPVQSRRTFWWAGSRQAVVPSSITLSTES